MADAIWRNPRVTKVAGDPVNPNEGPSYNVSWDRVTGAGEDEQIETVSVDRCRPKADETPEEMGVRLGRALMQQYQRAQAKKELYPDDPQRPAIILAACYAELTRLESEGQDA